MIKLYNLYIIKILIGFLLTYMLVINGVTWVLQLVKLLYLIEKGISFNYFLYLTSLTIPSLIFITLPFTTSMAILHTYQLLLEERQLTILYNAGLSNFQIAKATIIVGMMVTIIALFMGGYLMPKSYVQLKKDLFSIKNTIIANAINIGVFNKISSNITLYVDKKLASNCFGGIVLFDHSKQSKQQSILIADIGYLQYQDNNPILLLKHGIRQEYDNKGNMTKLLFDTLAFELKNITSIERNTQNRDVKELSIIDLFKNTNDIDKRKSLLKAEAHQRIMWGVYNLILPLVGLAIMLRYSTHSRKMNYIPTFLAMSSILIISIIHFTLQNFAVKDTNYIILGYINIALSFIFAIYNFVKIK